MKLEPRVGLDTIERWLVKEFNPTRAVVPGNVVHDLEWRTAGKIEVDVA